MRCLLANSLDTILALFPRDSRGVLEAQLSEDEERRQALNQTSFVTMGIAFSMMSFLLSERIYVRVLFKPKRQSTLGLPI
jgi:hypothetical protein